MDGRRLRFDLFAFALGALALLTFAFYSASNGAAVIMCGFCFVGLVTGRLLGFSNRALVPLAAGLVVVLWVVWAHPLPLSSREASAVAHGTGGLLVGWALSEYLRSRVEWPLWGVLAVGVVLGISIAWELGELLADRAFDTALVPSKRDSAADIAFGTLGGIVGTFIASLIPSSSGRR